MISTINLGLNRVYSSLTKLLKKAVPKRKCIWVGPINMGKMGFLSLLTYV